MLTDKGEGRELRDLGESIQQLALCSEANGTQAAVGWFITSAERFGATPIQILSESGS